VAIAAIDPRFAMPRVTEENEIRDLVYPMGWKRFGVIRERRESLDLGAVSPHIPMAGHAFRDRWKRRSLAGLNRRVTVHTYNFERRVLLVAERRRPLCLREGEACYGNENATSESE
jgi:hypothetical protein